MDKSAEIKLRLLACLNEGASFDEFRIWFADILRTAQQNDEPTQSLIWSVDFAFAKFGAGRWDRKTFRSFLERIAAYAVQYESLEVGASTVPQWVAALEFGGRPIDTQPASGCAISTGPQTERQTSAALLPAWGY